jgi:hypothetical protein
LTPSDDIAGLQLKIVAEDKIVDGRIVDFLFEWETNKSVSLSTLCPG